MITVVFTRTTKTGNEVSFKKKFDTLDNLVKFTAAHRDTLVMSPETAGHLTKNEWNAFYQKAWKELRMEARKRPVKRYV